MRQPEVLARHTWPCKCGQRTAAPKALAHGHGHKRLLRWAALERVWTRGERQIVSCRRTLAALLSLKEIGLLTAGFLLSGATTVWAQPAGPAPGIWRVHGVAAHDVLNARMGPGAHYPVIATFAADEGGLQQVTCVPLQPAGAATLPAQAQRKALPQPWCLMRSADLARSGWVAQRFLAAAPGGGGNPIPATAPSAQTPGCSRRTIVGGSGAASGALQELARQEQQQFLQADGFAPLSEWPGAASARGLDFHARERFPLLDRSALLPDHDLAAIPRAMLEFDFEEGTIQHPRYLLTYHVRHTPPDADCKVLETAYIQITRFNLGQQRYEDAIAGVPRQFWPPPEQFGIEPHVSWRLVSTQQRYMGHTIGPVSRRVLSDAEAAAMDCLGPPCTELSDPDALVPVADRNTIPAAGWQTRRPRAHAPASYREPGYSWTPGPARLADLLYREATGSADNLSPSEGSSLEQPEITLVISHDVWGQDSYAHGVLRQRGLMDHETAEVWLRLDVLPDPQFNWRQLEVKWRHPS